MSMPTQMVATLLLITIAVTGCGRRTALDTPYQAALDAREEAKKADQPLPPEPQKPAEDRRFILDGLID
jgi:predicted small lipoprotein YifL